ncbi:ABC transporter-like protein [Cryptosporidium ubiquitum]|uniref:ABC transporter-like protein n=1 Tax=Cryptosporidium ubiquitum TaxID=857276 RepID=A0A1J4MGT3_9CRYT|nr:ABC transporter-like protein [Cryptosporidium ubiquitum]OII73441.1 ABC transporter-like protein [Cryptosporidium ubiquitum]
MLIIGKSESGTSLNQEDIAKYVELACGSKLEDKVVLEYLIKVIYAEILENKGRMSKDRLFEIMDIFLKQYGDFDDINSVVNEIYDQLEIEPEESDELAGVLKVIEPTKILSSEVETEKFKYDPLLDLDLGASGNFNKSIPIGESIKLQKAAAKEKERQLRLLRQWEKQKLEVPVPVCHHPIDRSRQKLTDIQIANITIFIAGRALLSDASLNLSLKHKYGLIGRNGVGKSTLLTYIVRREIPGIPSDVSIACVEQVLHYKPEETVLDAVLSIDTERLALLEEEKKLLARSDEELTEQEFFKEENNARLSQIYERLTEIDAYTAENRAFVILAGLGFTQEMIREKVVRLSGGWRMRVALARAIYANPDVLLLDEPTNHLDILAVTWLENFLKDWDRTCVIVSHSRDFLNQVCSDIIHFHDHKLTYFKGNYDSFEEARSNDLILKKKQFEQQSAEKERIQKFIDRFRYNASKASLVQSRIKFLEKLPIIEEIQKDPTVVFDFNTMDTPGSTNTGKSNGDFVSLIECCDISFYYSQDSSNTIKHIVHDFSMSIHSNSKIAICGGNGSGKTTILKLIMGQLNPTKGMIKRDPKIRIGYFAQHHIDSLDLTLNSIQQLQARYPGSDISEEKARNFLGRFGITGSLALEPLYVLSGGQKSRVAIAIMAYLNPHILILDEPTNHLDLDAIQALIVALNSFNGGVIIVSHDAHLISCVTDSIWHIDHINKTLKEFKSGDFELYRKTVIRSSI